MTLDTEHPVETLLFFVTGSATDAEAEAMKRRIDSLAKSRSWTLSPPSYVDQTEDAATLSPGDVPIRTVGGTLKLYSGRPPWDERLPPEIDRAHLAETEAIVEAMTSLAREVGCEIGFELDGCEVGWIENGAPDNLLLEGLLEPWRASLRSSSEA